MFSLESARTKAYSSDLRWRMVYQRCVLGSSNRQIGERLCVDPSTVQRTVKLFEETGTVSSIQGCHEPFNKKLSPHDEMVLLELVVEHPSLYLQELQNHKEQEQLSVNICRYLQKQGISYKKLSFQASQ